MAASLLSSRDPERARCLASTSTSDGCLVHPMSRFVSRLLEANGSAGDWSHRAELASRFHPSHGTEPARRKDERRDARREPRLSPRPPSSGGSLTRPGRAAFCPEHDSLGLATKRSPPCTCAFGERDPWPRHRCRHLGWRSRPLPGSDLASPPWDFSSPLHSKRLASTPSTAHPRGRSLRSGDFESGALEPGGSGDKPSASRPSKPVTFPPRSTNRVRGVWLGMTDTSRRRLSTIEEWSALRRSDPRPTTRENRVMLASRQTRRSFTRARGPRERRISAKRGVLRWPEVPSVSGRSAPSGTDRPQARTPRSSYRSRLQRAPRCSRRGRRFRTAAGIRGSESIVMHDLFRSAPDHFCDASGRTARCAAEPRWSMRADTASRKI